MAWRQVIGRKQERAWPRWLMRCATPFEETETRMRSMPAETLFNGAAIAIGTRAPTTWDASTAHVEGGYSPAARAIHVTDIKLATCGAAVLYADLKIKPSWP